MSLIFILSPPLTYGIRKRNQCKPKCIMYTVHFVSNGVQNRLIIICIFNSIVLHFWVLRLLLHRFTQPHFVFPCDFENSWHFYEVYFMKMFLILHLEMASPVVPNVQKPSGFGGLRPLDPHRGVAPGPHQGPLSGPLGPGREALGRASAPSQFVLGYWCLKFFDNAAPRLKQSRALFHKPI